MRERVDAVVSYMDKCFCKEYKDYVFKEFEIRYIPKDDIISRVTLIPKDAAEHIADLSTRVNILFAGIVIGWMKKGKKFIPSTHLFNLAIHESFEFGCAVVAKEQGAKAFLYGKDLLIASVDRFLYPVERGLYVAVIDPEDMTAIGIGRLVINPGNFDRYVSEGRVLLPAVENVFDLGKLLRNESYV
uniref:UPF0113 domain-containing protein n=1 Tax=Ignisphaera aggregans TaxID=334771 RepID=A0A7C4NPS2_9CREN